jgi:7-cyano-7-deazaguanine synthase
MANLATRAAVEGRMQFRIDAPLISMTKAEIIRKGAGLGVDYSLTWSCYDPQVSDTASVTHDRLKGNEGYTSSSRGTRHSSLVPCRRCDSCILREKGFREAGITDPLV